MQFVPLSNVLTVELSCGECFPVCWLRTDVACLMQDSRLAQMD